MKKTVRINISGLIFNIDEDAYNKLQQYLGSITNKFLNTEEGNEIIADVEARIAELFQERIGDRKEVVNLSDIDYIIEIMGAPEDFEEVVEAEVEASEETHDRKAARRIYRDPDNRVLAGLASGIAAYLNVDPIIIRVIFVLLTFFYGTSILIYLLLWIIIPEAKTRSQKLEMRGQDINLSNIETSIKTEFKQVKTNFDKWQKSGGYNDIRSNIGSIVEVFGKAFIVFAKFVIILTGIGFFIAGIALLGTMTGIFFLNDTFLSPFSWNGMEFSLHDFILLFTDGFTARVGILSTYLLILIPTLSIIYIGLRFVFRFKANNRYIGVVAGSLWLVSLLVLISSALKITYGMRATEEISQLYPINNPEPDTLYIRLFDDYHINGWDHKTADFGNVLVKIDEDKILLFGQPRLDIVRSENGRTNIRIVRKSDGINKAEAIKFAKNIKYEWQQSDSTFYFRRFFNIDGTQKIKDQELDIKFEIPVGKVVFFGENIDYITSHIMYIEDYDEWDLSRENQYLIMTEDGLQLLKDYKNEPKEGKLDNENPEETKVAEPVNNQEIEQMKRELDSM
jgi:phage shock protein PspC (stress-responsive transcriptional regulator)